MTARVLKPFESDARTIVAAINQYAQGRSNAGGKLTCTISASQTTVTDPNVSATSQIAVCPMTGAASTEIGSGNFFIPAVTIAGSFLVKHTNSAVANRTFSYVIQG